MDELASALQDATTRGLWRRPDALKPAEPSGRPRAERYKIFQFLATLFQAASNQISSRSTSLGDAFQDKPCESHCPYLTQRSIFNQTKVLKVENICTRRQDRASEGRRDSLVACRSASIEPWACFHVSVWNAETRSAYSHPGERTDVALRSHSLHCA